MSYVILTDIVNVSEINTDFRDHQFYSGPSEVNNDQILFYLIGW